MTIDTESTFVIAEAGINHNGSLETAMRLVDEAAVSGADAVKFQIWDDATEMASTSESVDQLREWQFDYDEWEGISRRADEAGIAFFASVFDEGGVDVLVNLGAPAIKIASGDITHIPLLRYVAEQDKPVIMSTGMSTLGEVERAVNAVDPPSATLHLLECVSTYPATARDLNLSAMQTLRQAFGRPVGFSDHTEGVTAPVAAVAMGARIVEKHLTLDKSMDGPDHELSAEPDEFADMVDRIETVEEARGDGIKRPQESESEFKRVARRGLKARNGIAAGETLTRENVKVVRPNDGIDPEEYANVLGREAVERIEKNDPITWAKVEADSPE
jgi:N-acetylneuraminate synthase/N,N'-diacetyllegionaminate synthase